MGRKRKIPLCQEPDLPGLPELTGKSEKQIDWGIRIRDQFLFELNQWIKIKLSPLPLHPLSETERLAYCQLYTKMKIHIYSQTHTVWFIIRHNKNILALMQELQEDAHEDGKPQQMTLPIDD
jgi:hypothetical protein